MKTFSGRNWGQQLDELQAFIGLLNNEGVGSYLEVGARYGDTFHAVMTSLPKGSKGVAVDLPGAIWGRDSRNDLERAVADLCQRGYQASVCFGDSRSAAIREMVSRRGPYDAALIDGDHRYEGVLRDWLDYGPLAKIVAFHDIDGEGMRDGKTGSLVQVPLLWEALKQTRNHREIIGAKRGMGIGVLWN